MGIALGQSFLQDDVNHLSAHALAPVTLVEAHLVDQENVTAVQLIAQIPEPDRAAASLKASLIRPYCSKRPNSMLEVS